MLRQRSTIRQEPVARDFSSAESLENRGILGVFPVFQTARMGENPRHPATDPIVRCCLSKNPERLRIRDLCVLCSLLIRQQKLGNSLYSHTLNRVFILYCMECFLGSYMQEMYYAILSSIKGLITISCTQPSSFSMQLRIIFATVSGFKYWGLEAALKLLSTPPG